MALGDENSPVYFGGTPTYWTFVWRRREGERVADDVPNVEALTGSREPPYPEADPANGVASDGHDGAGGGDVAWWALMANDVADRLVVDPTVGLAEDEVKRRLDRYGPNGRHRQAGLPQRGQHRLSGEQIGAVDPHRGRCRGGIEDHRRFPIPQDRMSLGRA